MSTLVYALKFVRVQCVPHWSENLIVVIPLVAQVLEFSAFQITVIQFSTDQLQGASSDKLTALIFWFFLYGIAALDGACSGSSTCCQTLYLILPKFN